MNCCEISGADEKQDYTKTAAEALNRQLSRGEGLVNKNVVTTCGQRDFLSKKLALGVSLPYVSFHLSHRDGKQSRMLFPYHPKGGH